jgi:hypothetical protein
VNDLVIKYDPEAGIYTFQYTDHGLSSICEAITKAVSLITNRDPLNLDPLYNSINPDALDALFSAEILEQQGDGILVSFSYCEFYVTVTEHEIRLQPLSDLQNE